MLEKLVGSIVQKIYFNEEYLKFETDKGTFIFTVEGDCCSSSMFYDFYGVKKLLKGNPVISTKAIDLDASDVKVDGEYSTDKKSSDESIQVYGYELVTKDSILGEVTSVLSFRNYSNGYYGGWMQEESGDTKVLPEITDDVVETVEWKEEK